MTSAGGHKDCEPRLDAMLNAIKHRLAFPFLYPEELIQLMDLCTDIFTGLESHHDELTILRRIQDCAKRLVLLAPPFGCFRQSPSSRFYPPTPMLPTDETPMDLGIR